jgi:hypothetical protein
VAEAKLDVTDELLVAYIDDELDAAQRAMVNVAMDHNPALCRRADEMRLARDLLREAFPLQPDASVPPRMDAAMDRLAAACASGPRRQQFSVGARYRWNFAIAAGLVLCAVVAAGLFALRGLNEPLRGGVTALTRIDPKNPLYGVLESTASSEVIEISEENAAVRVVLTFRAQDGRFCREFEVLASSGGSTGIACREQQGAWRAEVLLKSAAVLSNDNSYTPAGGSDEPVIAEVFERLIKGEPLSAQEEARVLVGRWRTTTPQDP